MCSMGFSIDNTGNTFRNLILIFWNKKYSAFMFLYQQYNIEEKISFQSS